MNKYIRILDLTDAERFAAANAHMVAICGATCRPDMHEGAARSSWARVAALEAYAPAFEPKVTEKKLSSRILKEHALYLKIIRAVECNHDDPWEGADPCDGCKVRRMLEGGDE